MHFRFPHGKVVVLIACKMERVGIYQSFLYFERDQGHVKAMFRRIGITDLQVKTSFPYFKPSLPVNEPGFRAPFILLPGNNNSKCDI